MAQHVTAHHLTRQACVYVRQSTLQQVLENTGYCQLGKITEPCARIAS
jgi:hypothetical protein